MGPSKKPKPKQKRPPPPPRGVLPTTTNKKSKSALSINSAYTKATSFSKLNFKFLSSLECTGFIESTIWPYFLSFPKDDDQEEREKAAILLAAIINLRQNLNSGSANLSSGEGGEGGEGGGEKNGLFSFFWQDGLDVEIENAFDNFVCALLSVLQKQKDAAMEFQLKTQVVQFLISLYSTLLLTPSSTNVVVQKLLKRVGLPLLSYVPGRYRELELKRYGILRKKWGYFLEKGGDKKEQSFVVNLVQDLLEVLGCGERYAMEKGESEEEMLELESEEEDDASSSSEEETPKEEEEKKSLSQTQQSKQAYLHKSLEFLIDLLSSPTTRPYLHLYLSSIHFTTCVALSPVYTSSTTTSSHLLSSLVSTLSSLSSPMNGKEQEESNNVFITRAHVLQKLCHRYYSEYNPLVDVIYAGVTRITSSSSSSSQTTNFLEKCLDICNLDVLDNLAYKLRLVDTKNSKIIYSYFLNKQKKKFLMRVLVNHHTCPSSQKILLATQPLYPTETILWNFHLVPSSLPSSLKSQKTLSLPKLNTSFLSIQDYLSRNYTLCQLESAHGIREDIVDVVKRMRPSYVENGYTDSAYGGEEEDDEGGVFQYTKFNGWAKMSLELTSPMSLLKVSSPKLGETIPSEVVGEFKIDLKNCGERLRDEWENVDGLKEFDNLFLCCVDARQMNGELAPFMKGPHNTTKDGQPRRIPDEEDPTFPHRYGITAVRGCMVLQVRDEDGTVISDPTYQHEQFQLSEEKRTKPKGYKRFVRVLLDSAQYAADATSERGVEVYKTLNVVIRRHGRENNFKSILETIRGLLTSGSSSIYTSIPKWLQPVLLGSGNDMTVASFTSPKMRRFAKETVGVTEMEGWLDYGDTFLEEGHLRGCFGEGCEITVDGRKELVEGMGEEERKKYRVRVMDPPLSTVKVEGETNGMTKVEATSYDFPSGLKGNPIRFTPVQVRAIRSGLSPGLTLIVGPPGTGKTDVAVQIIANLYHSFPTQRTVLVTHSNAALNDLFEKVMSRGDINERYMLRLGSGERDLQTTSTHDFTKTGRVAHILSRRAELLEIVQCVSESLGVSGQAERGVDGSPSYTCETAGYFNLHHVQKRIQLFEEKVRAKTASSTKLGEELDVGKIFPFKKYFGLADTMSMTIADANAKFDTLNEVFSELAEYRPLELLRSQRQRTDYLLTKQARIVAMTCTHAAIARSHLVNLGFQYDNIVMEEAGQMLDVETCIPLLLQKGEADEKSLSSSSSRLKRVCLIGDHHQLPPVVKNMSFSKFSHLDQSLFTRLIRLGVPSIELDKQGRARADIAKLYSWRYRNLGDLEHVNTRPAFKKANTGFAYTYQVINVDDFEGRGESTPTAYFYQNLGEAEYAVALFQYMVLVGYPPEKISILTTYNGQKELLNDILSQRCGPGTPLAGKRPGAVSTVDQYQGQQNDFVLLSLVRTRSVGHLRDIRRLVVAVSRARLGLYVFCRQSLFGGCHELRRTMDKFAARPSKLRLVPGEHYPTERSLDDTAENTYTVEDVSSLGSIVHSMQEELCSPSAP